MNRNLYLEIRRLVNVLRGELPREQRFIFDEYAIMCDLFLRGRTTVSELASSQAISCSTMVRRGDHMKYLGLIESEQDEFDRRLQHYFLSEYGTQFLQELIDPILESFADTRDLVDVTREQLLSYSASMGKVPMTADSLVLFCYSMRGARTFTIADLIWATGMSQSTVSMAVLRLQVDGFMEMGEQRRDCRRPMRRDLGYAITASGSEFGAEIVRLVEEL